MVKRLRKRNTVGAVYARAQDGSVRKHSVYQPAAEKQNPEADRKLFQMDVGWFPQKLADRTIQLVSVRAAFASGLPKRA